MPRPVPLPQGAPARLSRKPQQAQLSLFLPSTQVAGELLLGPSSAPPTHQLCCSKGSGPWVETGHKQGWKLESRALRRGMVSKKLPNELDMAQ